MMKSKEKLDLEIEYLVIKIRLAKFIQTAVVVAGIFGATMIGIGLLL